MTLHFDKVHHVMASVGHQTTSVSLSSLEYGTGGQSATLPLYTSTIMYSMKLDFLSHTVTVKILLTHSA